MNEDTLLSEQFEAEKTHLKAIAYRMLGSQADAEDAIQEAWVRLSRSDAGDVHNLGGWLTTVVARVCLDVLRSRSTRDEVPLEEQDVEEIAGSPQQVDAEQEMLLADSIGPALMIVLDTLAPAERVAFVLHELFAVSFDEIALILGRSSAATRQLASRARRRVEGRSATVEDDRERQCAIVQAFLSASRRGDFDALLMLLDPDVVHRKDAAAVLATSARKGAPASSSELRGRRVVAHAFAGRATAAQSALIDGMAGAAWAPGGTPRAVFMFKVEGGKIVAIDLVADPARIRKMKIVLNS